MILLNPFNRSVHHRDGLPILPGAFPLVGHVPALLRDAATVFERGKAEFGPMFWFTTGSDLWMLHCMGAPALELLKSKSFSNAHLQEISPYVARGSILALEGQAHRRVRGAMNGPFQPRGLSASTVSAMTARALSELAVRWVEQKKIRVLSETREVALRIIFRMIGIEEEDISAWTRQYRDLLLANYGVNVNFPGSPIWRAARAHAWIKARLLSIIEKERREHGAGGLVAALARATDEHGAPLSDDDLTDNLRLLLLGGHETVSAMMAWLVFMLASRPDLWAALSDEATKAAGVPTTPEEVRAFPFAEALFRETLRFYPPFGSISRRASEDAELYGNKIRAGTMVSVDLMSVARDPSLYTDPDAFLPSRWLEKKSPPTAVELSSFGAGPHFCLGYHVAWMEAVQLAVALAREMAPRGLRPRLPSGERRPPHPIYVPTVHPPARATIEIA